MQLKRLTSILRLAILLLPLSPAISATLHETRTVYTVEQELAGIDVYQKMYFVGPKEQVFVREHNLLLNVAKNLELGIQIPFSNNKQEQVTFSRVGDIKFHVNIGTNWWKSFGRFNYYVEYNVATGANFIELSTHGMESYGHQELRQGLIMFKRLRYFSIHGNLFYVFRAHEERNFFNSFFGDGVTLNPFQKESYKRGFGFNPKNDNTFFYEGNLKNDNLEYNLAFNTDLPYPLVPFVEFTFSHDFHGDKFTRHYLEEYNRRAPGAGYYRSQATIGTKYFLADDHFVLKLAFTLPLGDLRDIHQWGTGFGVRIDF